MEVIPGGSTGIANVADDVAPFDLRAGLDGVVEQMPVAGLETKAVVQNDQIAVAAVVTNMGNRAVCSREDRLAAVARDIESGVEIGATGDRIRTASRPRARCGDRRSG